MKSSPPRCLKPRSSTESTRRPSETFARIGFSATSNASSVIGQLGDAHRHGALLAPHEDRQRRLDRQHLERAPPGERVVRLQVVGLRLDERLERGELGLDAERDRVGRSGVLEPLGRVDLRLELDRLDGGAAAAGAPRSGSPVSPLACTCSVRVSVSGLYWSAIVFSTFPVVGSYWTRPPLTSLAGNCVMSPAPAGGQRHELGRDLLLAGQRRILVEVDVALRSAGARRSSRPAAWMTAVPSSL